MGVHISFVRSTILDTWNLNQLRNMKLGGNENAKIFFNQYGGIDKYSDPKEKYQSKAAILYKEHLKKLVEEDIEKYPDKIVIDEIQNEDSRNVSKNNSVESSTVSSPKSLSSSSLGTTPAPIPLKPRDKHTPGSLLKSKSKKNVKANKIIKGVNFEEVVKRVKEEEKKKQKEEKKKKNKNNEDDDDTLKLIFLLFICTVIIIIIVYNIYAFFINLFK